MGGRGAGSGAGNNITQNAVGRFSVYGVGKRTYTSTVSSVSEWEKNGQKRTYFNLQNEIEGFGYVSSRNGVNYDLGGVTNTGVPRSVFIDRSNNAPSDKFRSVKTDSGIIKYSPYGINPKNLTYIDNAIKDIFRKTNVRNQDFLEKQKRYVKK